MVEQFRVFIALSSLHVNRYFQIWTPISCCQRPNFLAAGRGPTSSVTSMYCKRACYLGDAICIPGMGFVEHQNGHRRLACIRKQSTKVVIIKLTFLWVQERRYFAERDNRDSKVKLPGFIRFLWKPNKHYIRDKYDSFIKLGLSVLKPEGWATLC